MLEFPESLSVVVLHCQSECVGYLPGLVEYQVTEPYWRVGGTTLQPCRRVGGTTDS